LKYKKTRLLQFYLPIINQGLQIIALLTAALWAIWNWHQWNSDSLNTGINVDFDYKSKWLPSEKVCRYDVNFEVINMGKKRIDISSEVLEMIKAPTFNFDNHYMHIGGYLNDKEGESIYEKEQSIYVSKLDPEERYIKTISVFAKPDEEFGFIFEYKFMDEDDQMLHGFKLELDPCVAPKFK